MRQPIYLHGVNWRKPTMVHNRSNMLQGLQRGNARTKLRLNAKIMNVKPNFRHVTHQVPVAQLAWQKMDYFPPWSIAKKENISVKYGFASHLPITVMVVMSGKLILQILPSQSGWAFKSVDLSKSETPPSLSGHAATSRYGSLEGQKSKINSFFSSLKTRYKLSPPLMLFCHSYK